MEREQLYNELYKHLHRLQYSLGEWLDNEYNTKSDDIEELKEIYSVFNDDFDNALSVYESEG